MTTNNKNTALDYGNQLIVITGARGTGKTMLAGTFEPPSKVGNVFWHDSEDSANNFLANLELSGKQIGHYVSMRARYGKKLPKESDLLNRINAGQLPWVDIQSRNALVDYYIATLDDLNTNLSPGGPYTTYIHDTIELLEASMAAWVDTHKKESGVSSVAFGKLWSEGVFPLYGNLLSAIHARGVRTIIFTSHLKTPWEGNRPVVGKVVPSGKKILYFLSRLMLWLVREQDNADGAPAALILKERMGKIDVNMDDDEWDIQRRLPRRIPHCTWRTIREYLNNGCDLINPAPGETPSPAEQELLEDMAVSDRAMELMILEAKKELAQAQQNSFLVTPQNEIAAPLVLSNGDSDEFAVTARKLRDEEGLTPIQIRERLSQLLGAEIPLPEVIRALK